MSRGDDIRERDTEVVLDSAALWAFARAIHAGAVHGFTPSPGVETDAERAQREDVADRVTEAIRTGRRDVGR